MQKHIAVLTSEYRPSVGGVGVAAERFASAMCAHGFRVSVLATQFGGASSIEPSSEATIYRFAIEGDGNAWNPVRGEAQEIRRTLDELNPDVVVIHGWQGWCPLFVDFVKSRGIPVVLQSHGYGFHRWYPRWRPFFGLKQWLGNLIFVARTFGILRKLNLFVPLNKVPDFFLSFDLWLAKALKIQNIVSIPNAVPALAEDCCLLYDNFPALQNKTIISTVANYCDRKNQLLAIQAFQRAQVPNSVLVLLGSQENDYSKMLKRFIQENGMESCVLLIENPSRPLAESLIRCSRLALLTSKWEMQPFFLLEAMSCGIPWVSTEVGSVRELQGGRIVNPRVTRIRRALEELLVSPSAYKQKSIQGYDQWIQDFSPERVYALWEKLITQTVNKYAKDTRHDSTL